MATKNGLVKKTDLMSFSRPRVGGIIALNLLPDDELIAARLTNGTLNVFLGSLMGKAIRFHESDIRPSGRTSIGVRGMNLDLGDKIVALEVLSHGQTLFAVTENGYGKRTSIDEYPVQKRGGKGVISIKTTQRNGLVVSILLVEEENDLMLMTNIGKIIRMSIKGISLISRNTQGVKLMGLEADERVVGAARLAEKGNQKKNKTCKLRINFYPFFKQQTTDNKQLTTRIELICSIEVIVMQRIDENDVAKLKIGVVGAGSWGTALANLLAGKGYAVDLWVFEQDVRDQILASGENSIFLPDVRLSSNLHPSNDIAEVVSAKDIVVVVVPSHVVRETTLKMASHISKETIIVSASKGIENKTHLTMTGVMQETLTEIPPDHLAVISGPSFAREVARNLPTVVTAASKDPDVAALVQQVLATPYFRVYTSDDLIGVELGGSIKNVIAIAAGLIDGLELGLNTRAALITRGMTEIRRLGLKMGANPRTFTGLAGFGDLILTCTGHLSRNYTVGKKIGQGEKVKNILGQMRMVAEGVKTAESVYNLSRKLEVEMPISHETYRILFEDLSPREAVTRLMTRDLKQELDEE
jgi:glycerol-3-phosphate dehydrogenase (NAD(P)+)